MSGIASDQVDTSVTDATGDRFADVDGRARFDFALPLRIGLVNRRVGTWEYAGDSRWGYNVSPDILQPVPWSEGSSAPNGSIFGSIPSEVVCGTEIRL